MVPYLILVEQVLWYPVRDFVKRLTLLGTFCTTFAPLCGTGRVKKYLDRQTSLHRIFQRVQNRGYVLNFVIILQHKMAQKSPTCFCAEPFFIHLYFLHHSEFGGNFHENSFNGLVISLLQNLYWQMPYGRNKVSIKGAIFMFKVQI